MLESFMSKVPSTWDVQYIISELANVGVINHFGFDVDAETGEYRIKVLLDDADKLLAIISNYQTAYLSVIVPQRKATIKFLRSQRVQNFSFNGITLDLDSVTEARITGAAVGLTRNPDCTEIHWDAGELNFITIPRDVMLALADATFNYVQSVFNHSKDLGAQLDAATSVDQVLAIDIHNGWPT